MALDKKTLRLLVLEDSQNEAERLVNLFRNAGHATRVHRLTSSEDLSEALQQTWDLLISAPTSENLDPGEAIRTIRRQARDIPVIQLTAGNDPDAITEALLQGAQDALPQSEDERLILIAHRELANLEERRARRTAEIALHEAEKRCQLLLESSVDAIAYVHDGMHIYANRAYLDLFDYADGEELEGMPMIDLIAPGDQTRFKDFLKGYQHRQGNAELTCSGLRADGEAFKTQMHFSPASYDGEPCIQVLIRAESDNAELEEKLREISSQDLVTGLHNRNHFLQLMDEAVERVIRGDQGASLAFIHVDRLSGLQSEIGLADSDLLLADLAALLSAHFPAGTTLARFGDDIFAALQPGLTPQQAEPGLRELLRKVEGHLFDISGRTVQVTLSIGVAGLDEQTPKAQEVIDRAHRCADELAEGNAVRVYDPTEELAAAANRGNVVALIKHGLEQNGFQLLFQPIISLRGDRHEHYEVQLQLLSPQGSPVPPEEYLDAAIQAGLATTIDRWMMLHAIKRLAEHRSQGHDTRLFLSLSGASLQDQKLLPWLSAALKAARLPPDALVLQLSETDAVTYLKQARTLLQGLEKLHCKVALSEFGRTQNPFNTLKHLPADFVKVDAAFVQDLSRPENQETLKTLLANLHAQTRLTIVPAVDSATMLATLWQAGVHYIQGSYLQAPSQAMNYEFSTDEG